MHIPAKAEIRLNVIDGAGIIVIAPEGTTPNLDTLKRAGGFCAILTHDPGLTWPDRQGVSMVEEVLKHGGTALLEFTSIADALMCQARIKRERAR